MCICCIIIMQQAIENQLINRLLVKFEQDQSQATRDVIDLILNDNTNIIHYVKTFNLLLHSKCNHTTQRRDVAAIARLIADSTIFTPLLQAIDKEVADQTSTDPSSITIQVTKLISNICNQNPHFVDNILTSKAPILQKLFQLYSHEDTTPNDADSITVILNFLHNISLKETAMRTDKVGPCLQALLQNILSKNKFCAFISQKKFQSFVSSLFKFYSNVNLVAHHAYYSLMKSARSLNSEYKKLAEMYKTASQKTADASERTAVMQAAAFADRKLIAIMRLFQKARGTIFIRFDSFSFIGFLKILVKTAIMRPVALLNQPHQNRLLITLIHDLIRNIEEYKHHIEINRILPEGEKNQGEKKELGDDEEVQIQVPMQDEKEVFSARQIQRFKHQSQKFKNIVEVSQHMSQAYYKTTKTTIESLSFCFNLIQIDINKGLEQVQEYVVFLINILTVRLERLLSWILRLFPTQELKVGTFYNEIVKDLLKLVMCYYQCAIWAETKSVMSQVDKIEDVSSESQGSLMRYIKENIDEETVKNHIHAKLVERTNIFSTAYQIILKFVYHFIEQPRILRENMTQFVHKLIANLRTKYIKDINKSETLTFKQIETLRLSLRAVSQFFNQQVVSTHQQEIISREKAYRYCKMIEERDDGNNVFVLLAEVLNNLQKHQIQRTEQICDNHENRIQIIKTIFTKIVIQKAKLFITALTSAHEARSAPDLSEKCLTEVREYYNHISSGYFAYVRCMSNFIQKICPGNRFVIYKEEIIGSVLDRILEYNLFVQDSVNAETAQPIYLDCVRKTKKAIDQQTNALLSWIINNNHQYLHRLPLLVRRVLHFERRMLKGQDQRNAQIVQQQQMAHTNHFIQLVSQQLMKISLILTGKRLDLKIKIKQPKIKLASSDVKIQQELQRLANCIVMVGQLIKLIGMEQYFQPAHPQISPNYIYSLLQLITDILKNYKVNEYKKQVDQIIHGSLWMIEMYLQYYQYLKKRQIAQKREKKAQARRLKRQKKKAESKKQKYNEHFASSINPQGIVQKEKIEASDPSKKKKKPKTKKRIAKDLIKELYQNLGLVKNGSKKNLLDKSQAKLSNKSQKIHRNHEKKNHRKLEKVIRQYLNQVCVIIGNSPTAIIKNDTLSYLFHFVCINMKKNIMQSSPSYFPPQLNFTEILAPLLKIKVDDMKIPGYYLLLCKVGLQLFDQAHIKIDYQLAIKRYLYENIQKDVELSTFVRMLVDNFKDISHLTSQLVEIVCFQGEGQNLTVSKFPFVKIKYDQLLKDHSKKYKIQLKEGVEMHLINLKADNSSLKRKPSAHEENRILKASDYCPQSELFIFVEQLITHSIQNLFLELDKSFTYQPIEDEIMYDVELEPFTIRSVLQTLQYLVRQSPSLSPFIAKFKCKKILLSEMNAQHLKNKEKVSKFVMRLLTGSTESNENMQEIGFLSVILRLFSPLIVNASSGFIFELCLDSTPLIQISDSKTGKNGYIPFSSVIRVKIVQEIQNILFQKIEMQWLFRKLCLLNLLTVLINIRQMSKLFIQNGFISKIFKAFQGIKNQIKENILEHNLQQLPSSYVTHILSSFYLNPLSILQQINISLHYAKKVLKGQSKKTSIKTVLDRLSINSQLINADTFKKFKFKQDWPFHVKRNIHMLQAAQGEQHSYYSDDNNSLNSSISESYQSFDSDDEDNSSFMRYQQLMDQPQGQDNDSYISMSEPHQHLFNEQWDYSNEDRNNQQQMMEYPDGDDRVVQLSMSDDDGFDESDNNSDQEDIEDYINNEMMANREGQGSLIDQLSISHNQFDGDNNSSLQFFPINHHENQFTVNKVNEIEYYNNINTLINFQKIQSIPRISRAQKKQVHFLRFFLQMVIFNKRKAFNAKNVRLMSPHQIKQEKLIEDNLSLMFAFEKDENIKNTQFVQYNQIYRYDHYHKEIPKLSQDIQKHFIDYIQNINHHHYRRRVGVIHPRDHLIDIIPGWNITEVVNEEPNQSSSSGSPQLGLNDYVVRLNQAGVFGRRDSSSEHIHIESEMEEDEDDYAQEVVRRRYPDNIEELLRNSNLNMSLREFMRLDPQLQQDIIVNITEEANPFNNNETPHNSQVERHLQPDISEPLQEFIPQGGNQIHPQSDSFQNELQQSKRDEGQANQQQIQQQPLNQPQIQPEQQQQQPQPQQNENQVHQVYRKMSVEHSKKVSKDVIQALNKQGKNDPKFYQIEQSQLQSLLEVFFLTNQMEHSKFPYPLIETLCINTRNLSKLMSNLIMLLHLSPSRFTTLPQNNIIYAPKAQNLYQQSEQFSQKIYPGYVLRILHLLTHLTKSYSISMSLLQINKDICASLSQWQLQQQFHLSSFEMMILLLKQKKVAQSPMILSFLIGVLDNITMHYFYKNVHKIVEKGKDKKQMENQQTEAIRVNEDSVYQLGELLQSDFVGDNLTHVSKIIMRLSIEQHNLHNFINYLEQLVKNLTDQALQQVILNEQKKDEDIHGHLKIVNIMSIFYQMVKAFQTYPTSSERHLEVLASLRRIVQYEKIQELCERALKILFQSSGKETYNKVGQVVDCFFILHQIAIVTSTNISAKNPQIIHNNIAELGQIVQLRRSQVSDEQNLFLGKFNLSKLWKESINNPNFKLYVNNNIKRKMSEVHGRRISPLQIPIIKIASQTPHLMSFDNKYVLFKLQLKKLRGKDRNEMIHMNLKRKDVFEQSFQNFMSRSGEMLRGKLKIEFEDEQGEDAGGITREWFQLLSREMFNPNYGLFRSGSGGHTYHPSATSYYNDRHLDYFKFIGRITGKALYDGYLLDAYFTPAFYKHILNLPITYHDMEQEDYEYFKSLSWILQNQPIQQYLQLTFTYDCDIFGQIQTKELITNGANILVTEQNKMQYVQLIAYAKMATNIKPQLQAFLTGLHELIPHRLLKIFTEKELQIMISGRPTIDIEDLRRNTELVNYMKNDPIIIWLFEVLQNFDMQLRTAFIQFVTGSSRVPVEGFKDLRGMNGVQRFNIHREFHEQRLPRAHTCFNQLDLPNYKSKDILIEKLMYAITQGKEGFGMI